MNKDLYLLCPTDSEVFALLMASKLRLTESVLHELAHDRGIFYSNKDSREELVDKLATLTHDHYDILGLQEKRANTTRNEKSTVVRLAGDISLDDIKDVINEYENDADVNGRTTSFVQGTSTVVMNHEFTDFDYSKNTLSQRQKKEVKLEFSIEEGSVLVHLPANEKAKNSILPALKNRLEQKKKMNIPVKEIELAALTEPSERTSFFTALISKLSGYAKQQVVNISIASTFTSKDEDDVEGDELEEDDIKEKMLWEVRNIILKGKNVIVSDVYQNLTNKGFFVTGITWESEEVSVERPLIKINVSFDLPNEGRGFKYSIKYAPVVQKGESKGEHTKQFKFVDDKEHAKISERLENAATLVLDDLINQKLNQKIGGQ